MAEAKDTPKEANEVPHDGDHDRVQMLSLRANGTPDQHNPEIIGDQETAVKAAQEQFKQQAVSAADSDGSSHEERDKAAKAAEKRAESVVKSLRKSK